MEREILHGESPGSFGIPVQASDLILSVKGGSHGWVQQESLCPGKGPVWLLQDKLWGDKHHSKHIHWELPQPMKVACMRWW